MSAQRHARGFRDLRRDQVPAPLDIPEGHLMAYVTRTVHRLIAVLDRDELVHALDRMKSAELFVLWNRA